MPSPFALGEFVRPSSFYQAQSCSFCSRVANRARLLLTSQLMKATTKRSRPLTTYVNRGLIERLIECLLGVHDKLYLYEFVGNMLVFFS